MPMHIVMFLTNAYKPDPRVKREAQGLVEAGYRVTIICWDRRKERPANEVQDGIEIIRVHDVASAYGSGWKQLFYLPQFWKKAIEIALELKPDAVHCHDLDTLYAGRRIKKKLNCPLIYDAHEHYPALMSLYLPKLMVTGLVLWEKWLLNSADSTITASTVLRDEFVQKKVDPVFTLGNYPDFDYFSQADSVAVQEMRATIGVPADQLMVAYIAGFSMNRMLLPFIEASDLLPDVQFHIWGDGLQREGVEEAVKNRQNVVYHGWADAQKLPIYFHAVDVIYYGLRLDYPGAIYNAPNTVSQAMAAGKPVVATRVGDLGRMVDTADCGILIDAATPAEIAQAIQQLSDPQLRERLGENGVQAARSTYNAGVTQQKLTETYKKLL